MITTGTAESLNYDTLRNWRFNDLKFLSKMIICSFKNEETDREREGQQVHLSMKTFKIPLET